MSYIITQPHSSRRRGTHNNISKYSLYKSIQLASLFSILTFLLHVVVNIRAQHIGYELFGDELYYIICGHNLAWGYVDHPPIVALAARFSEIVLGWHSLA